MTNPLSKIFQKNIIILILILIFGFLIVSSCMKRVGIYEGLEGDENPPTIQGKEIKVSKVYKF